MFINYGRKKTLEWIKLFLQEYFWEKTEAGNIGDEIYESQNSQFTGCNFEASFARITVN